MEKLLEQRYHILRHLKSNGEKHYFWARDALQNTEILLTVVVLDTDIVYWQSVLTYYHNWMDWSQKIQNIPFLPCSDMEELSPMLYKSMWDIIPQSLPEKFYACCFVNPCTGWHFLREYTGNVHNLTPQFLNLMSTWQSFYNNGYFFGNLHEDSIVWTETSKGIQLFFVQVPNVPTSTLDTRQDVANFAKIWCSCLLGNTIPHDTDLEAALLKIGTSTELARTLVRCTTNVEECFLDFEDFWDSIAPAYPQIRSNMPRRQFLLPVQWRIDESSQNTTHILADQPSAYVQIWECGADIGPMVLQTAHNTWKESYQNKANKCIWWNCSTNRDFPLFEVSGYLPDTNEQALDFAFPEDRCNQNYLHTRQMVIQRICEIKIPTLLLISDLHLASPELLDYFRYLLYHIKNKITTLRIVVTYYSGCEEAFHNFMTRLLQEASIKEIIQKYQRLEMTLLETQRFIAQLLGLKQAPEKFSQYVGQITQNNPLHLLLGMTVLVRKNLLYRQKQNWCLASPIPENVGFPPTIAQALSELQNLLSPTTLEILSTIILAGYNLPWSFVSKILGNNGLTVFWELWSLGILHASHLILLHTNISWCTRLQEYNKDASYSNRLMDLIRQSNGLSIVDFLSARLRPTPSSYTKILQRLLGFGLSSTMELWWSRWQDRFCDSTMVRIGLEWAWVLQKKRFWQENISKITEIHNDPRLCTMAIQMAILDRNYETMGVFIKYLKNATEDIWQIAYYAFKAYYVGQQNHLDECLKSLHKALGLLQNYAIDSVNYSSYVAICELLLANPDFVEHIPSFDNYVNDGFWHPEDQVPFLYYLGWWQNQVGQYMASLATLQKAWDMSQQFCQPSLQCQILLEIGDVYIHLGNGKKGIIVLQQAVSLVKKENLKNMRPWLALYRGRLASAFESNIGSTVEESYREAVEYSIRVGDHICSFYLLLELSKVLSQKNEQLALQAWGQARQEFIIPTAYRELQVCLTKIYLDVISEQPPAIILESGQKALSLLDIYHYESYRPYVLYVFGQAYRQEGNIPLALENFLAAERCWEHFKSTLNGELQESFCKLPMLLQCQDIIQQLTKNVEDGPWENKKNLTGKRKQGDVALMQFLSADIEQNLQEQRRQIDRLRKLLAINQQLNSEHDLHRLLDLIMDTAIELTQAERGFLILNQNISSQPSIPKDIITIAEKTNAEERIFEVARNFEKEDITNPHFEISHSITENVIRTGIPILAKDASQDERFDGYRSVAQLKLHSILAVPLRRREKIIGAIYLDNRFERSVFSEQDKELLSAFGDQATLAIETAFLIRDNIQKQEDLTKSKEQVEKLNQKLSAANSKLNQKIERREKELLEVKTILQHHQSNFATRYQFHNLIGKSAPMQELFRILEKVTDSNIPVLIYGESGTGKELVARAIHFSGCRKDQNFLSENCAALSDTLLASELFGHVKGSFTGAYSDKKGIFELAHHGTLFLDEIGDMSANMQANLLRVLENGIIRRVGGKDEIPIDVRIISASNKRLSDMVAQGLFRGDLLYRLKVVEIIIPPLRERKEDIPLLVDHFLQEYAQEKKTMLRTVSKNALAILTRYSWPGNIRELRNVLQNVLSLHDDEELLPEHFKNLLSSVPNKPLDLFSQELSIEEYSKQFVELKQEVYNDIQLAKILGFSRKTLWEKRKKWGVFRKGNNSEPTEDIDLPNNTSPNP